MDQSNAVHGVQRTKQRIDHRQKFIDRNLPAVLGDQILKRRAFDIFHDDVRRLVRFKIVAHADNLRQFGHLGHGARFV